MVQWTTIRLLLILEVLLNLKSKQGDITAAFVHADVEEGENIYVEMPHGLKQKGKGLKLKKTLYGLRQSPRAFWLYLTEKMEACGMEQSTLDPCLFIGKKVTCICYVDDLIEGIYRLLLSDCTKPVNIGNPTEITLKEFAEEVIKLTGTSQKIVYKDLPVDDPKQRKPDITKAKSILGWEPKVDRAEGLKITYEYFRNLPKEEWSKLPKEFVSMK